MPEEKIFSVFRSLVTRYHFEVKATSREEVKKLLQQGDIPDACTMDFVDSEWFELSEDNHQPAIVEE